MPVNNGRGTEFRNYEHSGSLFGEAADAYIAAAGHYGSVSLVLVRHYAEDLGFEYLTASDKEGFNKVLPRFLTAETTNQPLLFEVFTDSKNESDSMETMLNLSPNVKGKAIKIVKDLIGKENFEALKEVIK